VVLAAVLGRLHGGFTTPRMLSARLSVERAEGALSVEEAGLLNLLQAAPKE